MRPAEFFKNAGSSIEEVANSVDLSAEDLEYVLDATLGIVKGMQQQFNLTREQVNQILFPRDNFQLPTLNDDRSVSIFVKVPGTDEVAELRAFPQTPEGIAAAEAHAAANPGELRTVKVNPDQPDDGYCPPQAYL